jgi:hypothetical protein
MTLTSDQRRALEMLADNADGCTVPVLWANGCHIGVLANLLQRGLATAHRERVIAGTRNRFVMRLRITDAGRQALG